MCAFGRKQGSLYYVKVQMKTLIKCHNTWVHYLQVLWFFPHACCRSPSAPADWWGSGQSTPPQSAPATEQQQCTHTHACMHIHMHTHTHAHNHNQHMHTHTLAHNHSQSPEWHTHTHICTCFAILPTYVTTPVLFIICTDGMIFPFLDLCVCVFSFFFFTLSFFFFSFSGLDTFHYHCDFPNRKQVWAAAANLPNRKQVRPAAVNFPNRKQVRPAAVNFPKQKTGQSCSCKLSEEKTGQSCCSAC